jgi:hypothetical protein
MELLDTRNSGFYTPVESPKVSKNFTQRFAYGEALVIKYLY